MKPPSHIYEFRAKDVIPILLGPLVPLALFALWMHAGAATGTLPAPLPILDTDRTILFHQADASRRPHRADLLLIGDSSCLMDVSATQLMADLPGKVQVLNLGTLSYLDLPAYATLLTNAIAANGTRPTRIVLLMHPEALRRPAPDDYHVEALKRFYAGQDFCAPNLPGLLCALGVETFRGRVLSRILAAPLPGGFGRDYGFSHDLWAYLSAERGSALDPGQFDPRLAKGNAEYRLAKALESASRTFRSAVPAGTRLYVALTPVPQSYAHRNYPEVHARLLQTWGDWLRADAVLTDLPALWPDERFASTTHLNVSGVRAYTARLAASLAARP